MYYKTTRIEREFDKIDMRLRGALLELDRWHKTDLKKTLTLTSLFRSLEENQRVAGDKNSGHLSGQGADIRIWDYSSDEIKSILNRLNSYPYLYAGLHKDHVHLSIRKTFRKPALI
jgi:uncharacterized protein YcbK (DUF882 family)